MVDSIKFPGVTITNLSWTTHIDAMIKKTQQPLFFLRRLRKFGMSISSLTNFYGCTTESILFGCITAWYSNCSAQDRKKQQRVVNTAQSITQANLPPTDSTYTSRCLGKGANIIKDLSHPSSSDPFRVAKKVDEDSAVDVYINFSKVFDKVLHDRLL
eukprot:g21891.t1